MRIRSAFRRSSINAAIFPDENQNTFDQRNLLTIGCQETNVEKEYSYHFSFSPQMSLSLRSISIGFYLKSQFGKEEYSRSENLHRLPHSGEVF